MLFDWSEQMFRFMEEGMRLNLVLTVAKKIDIQDNF